MAWAFLDDNFPSHPKTIQAGPLAAYLFVCGLCYCRKYHTDGFIPRKAVATMASMVTPQRLTNALVAAGFWEAVDGGFQVHGYQETYPDDPGDKEKQDERRRQKQDAGRKGGLASWLVRSASSRTEAEPKQPASNAAEPLRVGTGLVRFGSGSKSTEKENGTPPFDFWLRELTAAYPKQARSAGPRTEQAFLTVFSSDSRDPRELFNALLAAVANQLAGHQWRVKRMIPKLETWLRDGLWQQEHDQNPPAALLNDRSIRTMTSAAAFIAEDKK